MITVGIALLRIDKNQIDIDGLNTGILEKSIEDPRQIPDNENQLES